MKRRKQHPPEYWTVVYVMVNIPFFWWVKIGISKKKTTTRAKSIDKPMPGFPLPIFAVPLPFAYQVEQWLHDVLRGLSFRFYSGDGSTEWFWLPAILVAIPVLSVLFVLSLTFFFGIAFILACWIFGVLNY